MSTMSAQSRPRERRFIRDFEPAERIRGVFAISNSQLGKTKQDKPFLKCLIGDKTGVLPGRMWSIEPAHFKRIPTDGFVYLEAETQPYQGELQLIIASIDVAEPAAEDLRELIACSARPPEDMFADLSAHMSTLQHPAAKALAQAFLDDQTLMDAFKRCPAAKSMHHAYLGGLLEHTLNLLNLADRVCPLYPKISRDIVMLGLFLHDIGKTRELVYDRTFGYTDRGELVGHIVDGAMMLTDKAAQVMRSAGMRFPPNFINVLTHIILSHHGIPEYGAAKIPATPEAILVSMLDNLDAKTFIALAVARPDLAAGDLGGNFTEKHWALDTKLFRPDPLAQ